MFRALLVFLAILMSACSGSTTRAESLPLSSTVERVNVMGYVEVKFGNTRVLIRNSLMGPGAFDVSDNSGEVSLRTAIYVGQDETSFVKVTENWHTVSASSPAMIFRTAYLKVHEGDVVMVCRMFLPPDDGHGTGFIVHCNK